MDQHLVDDDLEDHRRGQGEELQRQRRGQHIPQHPAILDQGRYEPGDVEFGLGRNRQTRRDEDGAPGPDLPELNERHRRRRCTRTLYQDLLVADRANDEIVA
ncbi:hypothetical protein D3C85_858230 [compost metagenome]